MSHQTEHQRMKPVLDLARQYDIASNPHPGALFEAGNSGMQIWCTPYDHPHGWSGIVMQHGSFSKPCEYVGSVIWKWQEDRIIALRIETSAYALAEQYPDRFTTTSTILLEKRQSIFNRTEDLDWLKEKITWLFAEAGVPLLPFEEEGSHEPDVLPYALSHYVSDTDEYVVIVSPKRLPEEFCLDGYTVADSQDIWHVEEFPVDVILHPDKHFHPAEKSTEPDEGPLVERYENASRLGADAWLESAFEDSISGLVE